MLLSGLVGPSHGAELKGSGVEPMRRSSFTGLWMVCASVVFSGTVKWTMMRAPRWTAARSVTLAGTFASGFKGPPTYPQAAQRRRTAAASDDVAGIRRIKRLA